MKENFFQIRLPASAKSFPKLFYKFHDLPSIAKYWKDVQYICLNTRLGLVRASRAKAQGEQVKAQRTYRTVMTLREFQVCLAVQIIPMHFT